MKRRKNWKRMVAAFVGICLIGPSAFGQGASQQPGSTPANGQADQMTSMLRDLQQQVMELRSAVAEIHSEAAQYRAETLALRKQIDLMRAAGGFASETTPAGSALQTDSQAQSDQASGAAPKSTEQRVASLEESAQLLGSKIDEQYQTKVESASKYKVRLSGIVLLNLFSNHGAVDNQDFPNYAAGSSAYNGNGAFGATLRQSELGLDVFGPSLAGARTSGHFQFDFAGGFPNTLNGANYGLFRLRNGTVRLDWENTSIVAGQDAVFVSPLSPTSFASLAEPAFSYAGNLWGWIPQVRIEHRFDLSDGQSVTISGGILDNVDGEPPYGSYYRVPQAGERSGQPAYGSRLAWSHSVNGQPLTLGVAGFYSRQDWGFDRYTDGWAGMADWEIPLLSRLGLSGEFYRGRAIGGLGGGVGRSVLFSGIPISPATQVHALNSIGGWSQLKLKATNKLEFNGGFGLDNPRSADLRWFPNSVSYYNASLGQNRGALVNFIYRPKSNLLLSSEYRHLRTFQTDGSSYAAEQVNMMVGVLF